MQESQLSYRCCGSAVFRFNLNGLALTPEDHRACLKGKTKILSPCCTITLVAENWARGFAPSGRLSRPIARSRH